MNFKVILLQLIILVFSNSLFAQCNDLPKSEQQELNALLKKLAEVRNINNIIEESRVLNNISMFYWSKQCFEETKFSFLRLLEINNEIENLNGIIHCNNFLGIIYSQLGIQDSSIFYFEKVLDIAKKHNRIDLELEGLTNIASACSYHGNCKNAVLFAEDALRVSTKINSNAYLEQLYGILIDSYKELNQPEEVEKYVKLLSNIE